MNRILLLLAVFSVSSAHADLSGQPASLKYSLVEQGVFCTQAKASIKAAQKEINDLIQSQSSEDNDRGFYLDSSFDNSSGVVTRTDMYVPRPFSVSGLTLEKSKNDKSKTTYQFCVVVKSER